MLDRKLIGAFKSFVEKAILPTIKKTDPCILEWNKFSHYLTNDANNVDDVCSYVDSINTAHSSFGGGFEKR